MLPKLENAYARLNEWCQRQALKEAPYMPATALGTAIGFPILTGVHQYLDHRPTDSPWPFCLLLTGIFLHLAVGWGFEYRSMWKYNELIGRAAIGCCVVFWLCVAWRMLG